MLNIVVVSPFLLGDSTDSGGGVSALGFLKSLTPRHKLYVIALDQPEDAPPTHEAEASRAFADMQKWATHVRVVRQPITRRLRLRAKLAQWCFYPNAAVRTDSQELRAACREVLSSFPIDCAIVTFPHMAHVVKELMSVPRFMDVQDAYSVSKFRDYAAADQFGWKRKWSTFRIWMGWLNYERHFYKLFNHLFVVTEQDSYGLRVFNPSLQITVLPRIISVSSEACLSPDAEFDFGFIGSFIHSPNQVGLEFLFEKVLPLVLQKIPGFKMLVAGKNPPRSLVDRAPACVTFAGFVPHVEDFYSQIRAIAAPLITGGGIKIKVVEGMLTGLPVVTTNIGAEGILPVDGLSALVADGPEAFAAGMVRIANEPGLRKFIGENGRIHALNLGGRQDNATLVDHVLKTVSAST
jgi:glycosyltransferase involved in cell wall biosynthesis